MSDEDNDDQCNQELEAEFSELCDTHMSEISEQIEIAAKAIAKAEEISEKYGIPFSTGVSPLGQSYFPASFPSKFGQLDAEFVSDVTGAYTEYYNEGVGWEHSDVC